MENADKEINVWVGGVILKLLFSNPDTFYQFLYSEFPELKECKFKSFNKDKGEIIFIQQI